jgi:putative glutamine amidotransferase
VIGITAAIESARWTVWEDVETNISQRTYSTAVTDAGALPVLLPANEAAASSTGQMLDLLDGLILAGGADIDPAAYGAAAAPSTVGFRAERDHFELAIARAALARGLPLLGICRGMELLNVACGGTLDQELADSAIHLHTPGRFADHEVNLEPGSLAARAVGRERVSVRSHHHQGLDRLGAGIVATGWAEPGEVVEAVEVPGHPWALGILWHAEEERPSPVIAALAGAARAQEVAA